MKKRTWEAKGDGIRGKKMKAVGVRWASQRSQARNGITWKGQEVSNFRKVIGSWS